MMLLKPWVIISIIIQFYYGRYLEYADETPPTRNKDNFMQFLIELLLLMCLFVAWGSVQCTWSQLKVSQCRLFLAKFVNFNEILKSIHSWTRFEGWQHHSPVTRMVDLLQLICNSSAASPRGTSTYCNDITRSFILVFPTSYADVCLFVQHPMVCSGWLFIILYSLLKRPLTTGRVLGKLLINICCKILFSGGGAMSFTFVDICDS